MVRKVLLGFAFGCLCSVYPRARRGAIRLQFAGYHPPVHMVSVLMTNFCDEINKRSGGQGNSHAVHGRYAPVGYQDGTGVATGIADIGFSHHPYSRGRFPVMEIMELPLGFPSSWIATHVANDFYEKFRPKEWDAYHLILFTTSPVNVIQTVSKPVNKLEDMKGMKIRGTGRSGDIVRALGAVPMPIETPDLYEAIRRGVVDGAYLTMETYKGFKTGGR